MLALAPLTGALAGIDDLPVTTIGGRQYHYYDVAPKQTVYSICHELGITKAQLTEANPSVASEGLKAFQRLLFPMVAPSADIHVVAHRETIYGISHRYGITPSQLEAWNPGVRDGIAPGDRLYVSDPALAGRQPETAQGKPEEPAYKNYTVKAKETFYSIAHSHGISVAELEKANPDAAILREGDILRIPVDVAGQPEVPAVPTVPTVTDGSEKSDKSDGSDLLEAAADSAAAVTEAPAEVNIAVVLPFMLNDDERGRRAELMTEWYKGFLLAVDSLRDSSLPIHIQTYDTEGTDAGLTRIIDNPELATAQVIIAPDNASQLDRLAAYGNEHGIDVLNLFVVADQSYSTNPRMLQATIPHDTMYGSAIFAIRNQTEEGIRPVFLIPEEGRADKQNFTDQLRLDFERHGTPFEEIRYTGPLRPEDLGKLDPAGRYAFIPNSSGQADLNRILPALIEYRLTMTDPDPMRLYGYPEWTTFRGETLHNMHAVNTYVYSRFFTSPDDPWARNVEQAFERWYGTPMAAAVPRQGLLGFDTGMFLIKALEAGMKPADAPVYRGVQNAFRFVRPAGIEGYVNDDLYFVNFRPSGITDRISL